MGKRFIISWFLFIVLLLSFSSFAFADFTTDNQSWLMDTGGAEIE